MGLIRLLLALSVIANHCGSFINNDLVGGVVAVQTFYIISGFYMSLVLNEKYINQNSSYKLFITNRLMKLMPLYWCVLIMVLIASAIITNYTYDVPYVSMQHYKAENPNLLSWVFLVLTNIFVIGQDIVMFLGFDQARGSLFFTENFRKVDFGAYQFLFIPQAWTLSIEITFYLIAPFIVRRGMKPILLLILLTFGLRLLLYNYYGLTNDPWTYRFFPTELMFFLLGYLSYQLYKKIRNRPIKASIGYIVLLGCILLTLGYYKIPYFKLSFLPFSFQELLYFCVLFIAIPFIFNLTKKNKIDRILGDLSFPVYIVHYFVYCVLVIFFQWGYIGEALKSSFSVAIISIILSYLLNKFLMDAIERKRQARLS